MCACLSSWFATGVLVACEESSSSSGGVGFDGSGAFEGGTGGEAAGFDGGGGSADAAAGDAGGDDAGPSFVEPSS